MLDVIKAYKKKKRTRIKRAIWQVDRWINDVGIDEAFKVVGSTLLYSGPRNSITKNNKHCGSNYERTYDGLNIKHNSLLDETYIGKKAFPSYRNSGLTIYYLFLAEAFAPYKDKKGNLTLSTDEKKELKKESDLVADSVMRYVSKKFISHAHGEVETCVCGAAFNRVFYDLELRTLMKNNKITKINGVPREELKATYDSGDKNAVYNTYTEICLAELEMIHTRAMHADTKGMKNFWMDDYHGRRKFFELEQQETGINYIATNDDIKPTVPTKGAYRKTNGSNYTHN